LQHIFSPTLINNTRGGVIRTRAANEIDCCAKLPIVGDPAFGFVPGNPVGQFNTTASGTYSEASERVASTTSTTRLRKSTMI